MGIKLSTLTLTERALLSTTKASPLVSRAREIANIFISDRGSFRGKDAALSFLRKEAKVDFDWNGSYAMLSSAASVYPTPAPYGVKGGAAREHLIATLGIRKARAPRDIDLVRRGSFRVSADDEAARKFMKKDYDHGARVELIPDLPRYLASRDITINELAVFDSSISTSLLSLLDTIGHVLRPSYYRGGTLHKSPSLDGSILLKMVRLYAEGACAGESWSLVGIPEETSFSEFDLAIHVNKAFQRDRVIAERFLHTCSILSLIPASDDFIRDTLENLQHLRYGEKGLFPDIPDGEWERCEIIEIKDAPGST